MDNYKCKEYNSDLFVFLATNKKKYSIALLIKDVNWIRKKCGSWVTLHINSCISNKY